MGDCTSGKCAIVGSFHIVCGCVVGVVHILGYVHCVHCGCALCSALCIITAVKNNYPKESAEGAKHKLQRPKPKRFGLQETTFGSSRQNNQGQ